ncbi:hypothetical protein EV174_003067 [Coemansia sp. RSA 2320]|nr:hypothetical protein EV174_003067 [Coemansia sp. RSA 2320]
MGKRVADKQLTQLNQFEEETDASSSDQAQNSSAGFHKADPSALAQRVIKVPKSRLRGTAANANVSASASASAASPPTNTAAFSSFSGFGSTPANTSDTASESSSKGAFKGFSFGQTPTPAAASAAGSESKPAPSAVTATATAGAFTSTGAFASTGAFGSAGAFKLGAFGGSSAASDDKSAAKPAFNFGSKASSTFSFAAKPVAAEKSDAETSAVESKPAPFAMPSFKPPTTTTTAMTAAVEPKPAAFGMQPFKPPTTTPSFSASTFAPVAPTNGNPKDTKSVPVSTPATATATATADKDEEFYKNIRGLNVSLQTRIANALDSNAFVDLTPLLEQYRDHWSKLTTPATAELPTSTFDNSRLGSAASKTTATPAAAPVQPQPPAFNFGATSASSSSSLTKPAASGFAFNFGKPQASSTAPADSGADAAEKKPVFSFGFGGQKPQQQPASAVASADHDEASANEDEDDNPEEEDKREPTTAGEEGETVEHQLRAKLYQWDKAQNKYKDLGAGILKINSRIADDGAKRARFICRQDGSNRITLNTSIFKNLTIEATDGKKRDLGMLVIVDGAPTRFLVRTKDANVCQDLFNAIERIKGQI